MRQLISTIALSLGLITAFAPRLAAQSHGLPAGFAPGEEAKLHSYFHPRSSTSFTAPPSFPVRSMAEWEEIDQLVITWTSYTSTLRQIVRYAVDETNVLIICTDSNAVKSNLQTNGIPTTRVSFLQRPFDSVWMRDYGANTVYQNTVDSVLLVEWIYNRPRPDDDVLPEAIATKLGLPLYATTAAPHDLVNTGGNFHTDGMGTAFASELILDENAPGNSYGVTPKTAADIDTILHAYMGIERFITMPTLPYDGIHHIDMHWRLLDEETLLVGEYPAGMADGPQIEANLQYVLANHLSVWGTPYRVVRIQMPPDGSGLYPSQGPAWNPGDYRTYTNNVFVNRTLLLPIYEQQYDTAAIRVLKEELPGFRIIGIDCNSIIQASGALHCITREVGSADQLQIAHQRLRNTTNTTTPYGVTATIRHRSGITSATLYWTTDTLAGFQSVSLNPGSLVDNFYGSIPAQPAGTRVYYYIQATAMNGKTQVRPMTAPQGWWKFDVLGPVANTPGIDAHWRLDAPFPNPASAITCIPVYTPAPLNGRLSLYDMHGRLVEVLHQGGFPAGESKYFIQAQALAAGPYLLRLESESGSQSRHLMIR
jgi:agmatine/peptidylarginine deiminase